METIYLLGTVMGLGFVAGVNLYATILALGLGIRLGLLQLHPSLEGLAVLGEPVVLVIAGVLYAVEFFADKIPWLDSAWDALHAVVRPLGAAILGATALGRIDPGLEVAAFLLCGGVAFATHSTKAGLRLVVNSSPEPFSNIALSVVEDVVAVSGTWLAVRYPLVTGLAATAFGGCFALLVPRLLRLARCHILAAAAIVQRWIGRGPHADDLVDDLPEPFLPHLPHGFGARGDVAVRCVAGPGFGPRRHRVGYLCLGGDRLIFLARQWWRVSKWPVNLDELAEVRVRPGLLFDRMTLWWPHHRLHVALFRDATGRSQAIAEALARSRSGGGVGG